MPIFAIAFPEPIPKPMLLFLLFPATGVFSVASSSAYFIALSDYRTTLVNYPSVGSNIRLETWLSFHTPTTGWTEEIGSGSANRFPFEILSN